MNLEQLRAAYADAREALREAREAAKADAADDALYTRFIEARDAADAAKALVERAEGIERARESHPEPDPVESPEARAAAGASTDARVVREAPVYPQGPGPRFFADLIRIKDGDAEARERLARNNQEHADAILARARACSFDDEGMHRRSRLESQARAISQTAGAGGEFVPPVWMNAEYEPLLRVGRAFADQCISEPLPDGTNSINVPKITTGASTAVQTTDGAAVSNTDLVTTSVTAQVQTIAGRTVASYQLVDMGQPSMDGVIYQDLLADYWRSYDAALISSNVTNAKGFLNVTGINAVTYTDATPTGAKLYVPFMQAKAQIDKGAFVPVDFSLWHPSVWDWYLSQLDSQSRPLALSQEYPAFNQMAAFSPKAQGVAGNFGGIPVVLDANVPVNLGAGANEARIGLFNRRTLRTYEGVPRFKVADQTNIANLQYQFVMYGYYAIALGRQPKMISVIAGTGLVVQSGF